MPIIFILFILLIAGFVAAYIATRGDYSLPETVDTDHSLPQITLQGHTFHSETFGDPNHPVAIVLHGGPGADYRYLLGLQALTDNYFVVFYDQRGAGLSTRKAADTLTTQDMVDDLDLFVTHYSPTAPVHMIGHSWGAMLASAYVGQHPDKVDKLVLAEPGALTNEMMKKYMDHFKSVFSIGFILSVTPVIFEAMHIKDADIRADYRAGRMAHLWEINKKNPYQRPGKKVQYPSWRMGSVAGNAILNNAKDANGNTDISILSANVENFDKPVLFLASEYNSWLGEETQKIHAALYPKAEVQVIKDSGHYLFNDNLDDSLTFIRAYFKDTDA